MPVEVEVHTVPHFKAPVNGKVEPRGLEHGGIFIFSNARSKKGHLLHKSRHCDFDMHTAVATKESKEYVLISGITLSKVA